MIARAAAADALVLVPRGEGELAAGTPVRYLGSPERAQPCVAASGAAASVRDGAHRRGARRVDLHEPRVDDVAVRREEARVAGLQRDHLAAVRVEHREVVGATIRCMSDPVAERPVRHLEA